MVYLYMVETITIPRIITRQYIKDHPNWIFLYGADYFRKGALGQMYSCHSEPNAFPLTTVYKMCQSASDKYWQDHWELGWEQLQKDMDMILYCPKQSSAIEKTIIIPLRKIGEGASRMIDMAPNMFKFMKEFIDRVKYQNLKIDYYAN